MSRLALMLALAACADQQDGPKDPLRPEAIGSLEDQVAALQDAVAETNRAILDAEARVAALEAHAGSEVEGELPRYARGEVIAHVKCDDLEPEKFVELYAFVEVDYPADWPGIPPVVWHRTGADDRWRPGGYQNIHHLPDGDPDRGVAPGASVASCHEANVGLGEEWVYIAP